MYRTSELALAAVLALSYPLDAIDRTPQDPPQFVFQRETGLDELIAQYWRGALRVEPQAYIAQLQRLEAQLYGNYHNDIYEAIPSA